MNVTVDVSDYVGHRVFRHGLTALEACEAVFRLLRQGDTAVDVGANQGIVTSAMAACVGPSGRVTAIEMMPVTFEKLATNVRGWGESRRYVDLVNSAVSDRSGTIHVGLSEDFRFNSGVAYATHGVVSPSHCTLDVPCVRLDALVPPGQSVRLMKLDVERHEFAALVGAGDLITEGRIQYVVFEDPANADSDAKRHLRQSGYTIFGIEARLKKPVITRFSPEVGTATESSDIYSDFIATLDVEALEAAFVSSGYRCLRKDVAR